MSSGTLSIAPLPVAEPGTAQLTIDVRGASACSISLKYTGRSATSKGKIRCKLLRDTVTANAVTQSELGRETEHAYAAGVYSKGNDTTFETGAPGTGVTEEPWLAWDNRVVYACDRIEVYAWESVDAANPGNLTIEYEAN